MFQKARIKLTAWYLLIIMLISISFSMVIFRIMTAELDRFEHIERIRLERGLPKPPPFIDPPAIEEIKQRLLIRLIVINMFILSGSALAGYFLAGRTLKPIGDMMDEQNRFITDASHELRTPLTALKSEIEVNLRNKNITLADAKRLLQSNLEEVDNLQVLSDGLIKLTQFQKGKNGIDMSHIQLSGIIKEAVRRVATAAKTKHIHITSTIPSLTVHGNAILLTELFIILLDNSVKYSKRGKHISVTAEKSDSHVIIRVTDQGYGIRAIDIPHLFDRFWRGDTSRTKTTTQGYGLGLAIAKQIVDHHRGTISVKSALDKETQFTILLPR